MLLLVNQVFFRRMNPSFWDIPCWFSFHIDNTCINSYTQTPPPRFFLSPVFCKPFRVSSFRLVDKFDKCHEFPIGTRGTGGPRSWWCFNSSNRSSRFHRRSAMDVGAGDGLLFICRWLVVYLVGLGWLVGWLNKMKRHERKWHELLYEHIGFWIHDIWVEGTPKRSSTTGDLKT